MLSKSVSAALSRAEVFVSEARKRLLRFEVENRTESNSADAGEKKKKQENQEDDDAGGGLFTFAADDDDDDDDQTEKTHSIGSKLDPVEARQPRIAVQTLIDVAARMQSASSSSGTTLATTVEADLVVLVGDSTQEAPKLKISNLHMPLGVGASAAVFRGELSSSPSCPVAVRVVMRHLNDDDDEIISAVASSCRSAAISHSVVASSSSSSPSSSPSSPPPNILQSNGAFLLSLFPQKQQPPMSVLFVVAIWELAVSPRSTWQAQLNSNSCCNIVPLLPHLLLKQCLQVAKGVRSLHRLGIIHRDVKGLNCFVVGRKGEDVVVLGDLDSCLVWNDDDADGDDDSASEPVGTVWFAAPELIFDPSLRFGGKKKQEKRASFELAAKADVWSLGVLFLSVLFREGNFLYRSQQQQAAASGDMVVLEMEKLRAVGQKVAEIIASGEEDVDGQQQQQMFSSLVDEEFPARKENFFKSIVSEKVLGVAKTLFEGCLCIDPRKRIGVDLLCRILCDEVDL